MGFFVLGLRKLEKWRRREAECAEKRSLFFPGPPLWLCGNPYFSKNTFLDSLKAPASIRYR